MPSGDIMTSKKQVVIEIDKLRNELDKLIKIRGDNLDSEVLKVSTELDEVLNRYYKLQMMLKFNLK